MAVIVNLNKPRKEYRRADFEELFKRNGHLKVAASDDSEAPEWLQIEFHGMLSAIPSLKNSRFKGQVPKRTIAFFQALDYHFGHAAPRDYYFGDVELSAIMICGARPRSFDPDNVATSIKDWLEPREKITGMKRKTARQWGIGIVDNDSTVHCFPLHSWQTGLFQEHSTLILSRWDRVRSKALEFITSHYTGAKK